MHFWPFDGWQLPDDRAVIVEVYPSIFRNRYRRAKRSADEQDAYAAARWTADMAGRGALAAYFEPPLTTAERAVAAFEGGIPGVRQLHSPGPTHVPDEVVAAMSRQPTDLGDPRLGTMIAA